MREMCFIVPTAVRVESRRVYRQGFYFIEDISNGNGKKLSGSELY
jgi:hypothetical protein